MNNQTIKKLQKIYGVNDIQDQINSGFVWKLEGSVGRFAMSMLECGACMLPLVNMVDYYGNKIPTRKQVKNNTKGSYKNSIGFWEKVVDGNFEYLDFLEENFAIETEI